MRSYMQTMPFTTFYYYSANDGERSDAFYFTFFLLLTVAIFAFRILTVRMLLIVVNAVEMI